MRVKFTAKYIEELGYKYKKGTISAEEQKDFDTWYSLQISKELDLSKSEIGAADELGAKLYENISNRLHIGRVPVKKRPYQLFVRTGIAATVLLAIFGSGLLYFVERGDQKNDIVMSNDVAPGRDGATLTLANGKTIRIAQAGTGKIAAQSGVTITKMSNRQIFYGISNKNVKTAGYNTLATSRGEQISVRLPDGSIVFLNAASSLRFPASFTAMKQRIVELTGEGYFEIAKDKEHPFIVKTQLQEVEVLGTHFNINCYKEESTLKTTLLEGRIRLSSGKESKMLNPGQQATLRESQISIRQVNTEEITAWKNNEFLFRDDDFRTNMRKIARWYDLEVIYQADAPDNLKLGGFLSRNRNLSAVIKLLETTEKVHFHIEGKKLYVSR